MRKQEGYQLLPIALIRPPTTPLRSDAADGIDELAASIVQYGVLQPIIVTSPDKDDRYEIIAGHRRYLAAQKAGLTELPASIKSRASEIRLIENLHRKNLHPLEESRAIQTLTESGLSQSDITERINKSNAYVSETLQLLKLSESIQEEWFSRGEKVAKKSMIAISQLPINQQREAWENVVKGKNLRNVMGKRQATQRASQTRILRPGAILKRVAGTRETLRQVNVKSMKPQSREKLKKELNNTISTMIELRDSL